MRPLFFIRWSVFYFLIISVCFVHSSARADTGIQTVVYEPYGTVCTNEYVYERIDTLGGYLAVESRTYMDSGLRWFETIIDNHLGAPYPVRIAYLLGYGTSTNRTLNLSWETMYYPMWTVFGGGSISNGQSETFLIAAEHNQQEVWKLFTNSFRSIAGVQLPDTILVTNIYITTLGPTQEPEPGMWCIVIICGTGLMRMFLRGV